MIMIDSEWDLGYGDTVFQSKASAMAALKEDGNVKELCDDRNQTVEGFISEGLISFREILLG